MLFGGEINTLRLALVGVLPAPTAPSARRDLLRRAANPSGAMVALIAAVFVIPLTVLTGFVEGRFATNPAMTVVTWVVVVLVLVWVLPFIAWGVGLAPLPVPARPTSTRPCRRCSPWRWCGR